ncbi:GrpB family protein [Halorussus gelatinilyticus]|uniref:GrpB family protein n=1 Tax=Halorussus gelatinilyticus TaxID=2937524 RepID=A0A8U0IGK4_9EURY|nr:GrpB family protein [Halorussus gelatinilyticus]UPV99815.1 GrpB family protein [Halorussus gelatinilyticus]
MVGLERGTVELYPSDPEWRRHYEAEVRRLDAVAGDRLLEYEHVGSTAVEGLAAKPIIDLLAVVPDLDTARDLVPVLEAHGYEHRPNDDVPGRLFFAKGPRTDRTHYLSLTERDSDCYREAVAFREYLRSHPETAAAYEDLKRDLAEAHPDDRERYTAEKSEFVQRVLRRAMA